MSIPAGATHKDMTLCHEFLKKSANGWEFWNEQHEKWHTFPTYKAGTLTVELQQPKPWSGPEDGLPPVGLEVEATYDDGLYSWGYWLNTKVLCYGKERTFVNQLSRGTDNDWLEGAIVSRGLKYRPIKTPEQLAADKRETAIRDVMDIAQVDCRVTAARLVDAGFKR